MNEKIVKATVEDWMGKELISFEGSNCTWSAIEWKEAQVTEEMTEEEENQILEDLYVIGYDIDGNIIPVQFG